MITIYYPPDNHLIPTWQDRLNRLAFKYELIREDSATEPCLVDGEEHAEGISAIEAHLESLEQFVKDWYDSRCDRYDFDPDAPGYGFTRI
ncbi:hypothetical protein [Adhaeribacter pallidiroseus]|uniref:Uncharacterized protein n=1 Tax=Adhaeribacter pallidiroseus TaxID=2072847 RepID=A0A369QVI1_9BACT|nr:hypothetical protein [Adhaeribacter pallidiroseus]RDC66188.1 hypothetical protein AHMF7616_04819 [Adhaeribacter pallidiroseus]